MFSQNPHFFSWPFYQHGCFLAEDKSSRCVGVGISYAASNTDNVGREKFVVVLVVEIRLNKKTG